MKIKIDKKGPRAQSGVIPYIVTPEGKIRIILVQTTHSTNWTIPKGGQEPNMTPENSAKKEAWEEAGLRGNVGKLVGNYMYIKGKTNRAQHVMLFGMEVTEQATTFPESHRRVRKIFKPSEAIAKCPKAYKNLMRKFISKLKKEMKK